MMPMFISRINIKLSKPLNMLRIYIIYSYLLPS